MLLQEFWCVRSEYAADRRKPQRPPSLKPIRPLMLGSVSPTSSPRDAVAAPATVQPDFRSQGRRVRKLMEPEIPLPSRLAVGDLMTSAPANSCEGMAVKFGCVDTMFDAVMKASPLSMVPTCGRPRTLTVLPSPPERLICTPVMRCSESEMVTSGNLPMSSAEMLSWIDGAVRLRSMERICEPSMPVTVTAFSLVASDGFSFWLAVLSATLPAVCESCRLV